MAFQQLPETPDETWVPTAARTDAIATDPFLYNLSPAQLWVGRLVTRINKADSMNDDWLPVFSCASTYLRTVFAALQRDRRPVLGFLLQKETGGMLLVSAILEVLSASASVGAPLVLYKLLEDLHNVSLAWALILLTLAATLFGRAKDQVCRIHYAWVQSMVRSAIFEKSSRLSPAARSAYPPERVINMSSIDADNLSSYMLKVHDLWSAPLQIVAIGVLTVTIMGPTALFGFALVFVIFISQSFANKGTRSAHREYIVANDERLGSLRELLYGIKGVKAIAYEGVFREKISHVREEQARALRKFLILSFGYFTAVNQAVSGFAAGVAFLAYYLLGNELTAAVVFPALTYFSMLYQPVSSASLAVTRQFAVWPSLTRLRSFLTTDEFELAIYNDEETLGSIHFTEATFAHPTSESAQVASGSSVLEVGSLTVAANELTIVIGSTGSGKSSFLKAILGDMLQKSGSYSLHGSVAYAAQDPWVFSGTLRDNVIFANRFDATRYSQVISACGLDQDFASSTVLIGESGNNLSGGQRARIALARAIYSDSDILLLDDPFAAVDAKTRSLLFRTIRALSKTVVLVTLHTHFILECDNAIFVNDSKVAWTGSSSDLSRAPSFLEKYLQSADKESKTPPTDVVDVDGDVGIGTDVKQQTHEPVIEIVEDSSSSTQQDVFEEEERATGTVSVSILKFYASCAGGLAQVLVIALMSILLTAAKTVSSYWFVWWIDDALPLTGSQYLAGYIGLTVSPGVVASLLGIVMTFASIRASLTIHRVIVDNILSAPLSYYHGQPVGRILNRFSHDVMAMDYDIMNALDGLIAAGSALIAAVALVAAAAPITLVAAIPCVLVASWFQLRFAVAAREIQRSASILHSPVLNIVSEALKGMSSIRAFRAGKFMCAKHDKALDVYMSAVICRRSLDTWVTFRGELASLLLLLVTTIIAVYSNSNNSLISMSETQAGLALSNATGISRSVYLCAWAITELQIQMNSIERLKTYYHDIPKENFKEPTALPPADFNKIDFKNVSVLYARRTQPALDSVSLTVKKGERVGIIGRTGSGKSTLIGALARLVDVTNGTIAIGHEDISSLDSRRLRSELVCTLPQEPLLFKGTIRENLDPAGRHSDEELLDALKLCQLNPSFVNSVDGLSREIAVETAEISAGQGQLLCAARVLLTQPRILLIDEGKITNFCEIAAANVDFEADAALQRALENLPSKTTIISVAHRAATLTWMDRVLTMDKGRVIEDGSPAELLQQKDSYFYQMVSQDGEATLRKAVAAAEARKAI
ncbi:P-loop containing nucleoside triphosphate hydrolase protein [Xylariales sp. PMI_506]|nr:P-loop containing nucleoside triphosphate hydrolase protein [Xylariales sp. PMI_506]